MSHLFAQRSVRPSPQAGLADLRLAATQARDSAAPSSVRETLGRSGMPLEPRVRGEFEARLGSDFSGVRVHADEAAARSARDVGALAYTVGNHVVFGAGRYAPGSRDGNKLLAHELTHVDQQRGAPWGGGPLRIGNAGEGEARAAESGQARGRGGAMPAAVLQRATDPEELKKYDAQIAVIRTFDEVKALSPDSKKKFDEIIPLARATDRPTYYSKRLEDLFKTEIQSAATSQKNMSKKIKDAADAEASRLKDQKKRRPSALNREEDVSGRRNFQKKKGRDGKTEFEIDATDVTDIAVRVKVFLKPKGRGVQDDVDRVVSLEDAIEKRASTGGYNFDVDFVKSMAGANNDVFEIPVDTAKWTTAGNFSGDDVSIAHELHHVLGLEQDRYDYTNHAYNKMFDIATRLHWFREEFNKKIPNTDLSMMKTGERVPLDDDICRLALRNTDRVADPNAQAEADRKAEDQINDCIAKRGAARQQQFKPSIDLAQAWLKKSAAKKDNDLAAVANRVFSKPPPVARLREVVELVPLYITFPNLLPSSELDAGCKAGLAFVHGRTVPQLGTCPDFLRVSKATQSRALVLNTLRLVGIGKPGEMECVLACDGGTPCGGTNNSTAWAGFIECSGKA